MGKTSRGNAAVVEESGFERLKRKIYENRGWVVFAIASFLIFVVPNWGLGINFGYAAWTCSLAVAFAASLFWTARTKLWFWLAITFILLVHVMLLGSSHWSKQHYFGATYRSLCEIDFIVTFAILWLTQKVATRGSAPPSLQSQNSLQNGLSQSLNLMHKDKG